MDASGTRQGSSTSRAEDFFCPDCGTRGKSAHTRHVVHGKCRRKRRNEGFSVTQPKVDRRLWSSRHTMQPDPDDFVDVNITSGVEEEGTPHADGEVCRGVECTVDMGFAGLPPAEEEPGEPAEEEESNDWWANAGGGVDLQGTRHEELGRTELVGPAGPPGGVGSQSGFDQDYPEEYPEEVDEVPLHRLLDDLLTLNPEATDVDIEALLNVVAPEAFNDDDIDRDDGEALESADPDVQNLMAYALSLMESCGDDDDDNDGEAEGGESGKGEGHEDGRDAQFYIERMHMPLYEGSRITLAEYVYAVLHEKGRSKATDTSVDRWLRLHAKVVLPAGNLCPPSLYIARKVMGCTIASEA